ncbi:17476_t:CDS:1, partial [Racocetra fulgida]
SLFVAYFSINLNSSSSNDLYIKFLQKLRPTFLELQRRIYKFLKNHCDKNLKIIPSTSTSVLYMDTSTSFFDDVAAPTKNTSTSASTKGIKSILRGEEKEIPNKGHTST